MRPPAPKPSMARMAVAPASPCSRAVRTIASYKARPSQRSLSLVKIRKRWAWASVLIWIPAFVAEVYTPVSCAVAEVYDPGVLSTASVITVRFCQPHRGQLQVCLKPANLILLKRCILPILSDSRISCSRKTACRNCLRARYLATLAGPVASPSPRFMDLGGCDGTGSGKDDVSYERI